MDEKKAKGYGRIPCKELKVLETSAIYRLMKLVNGIDDSGIWSEDLVKMPLLPLRKKCNVKYVKFIEQLILIVVLRILCKVCA